MRERNIVRNVFVITLIGSLFLLSLIFMAPWLKRSQPYVSAFIYSVFAPLCHQNPSRSFYFFGSPLAVCTRCLGIYTGFFLGTLIFPVVRGFKSFQPPKNSIFFIFSAPIVLDTFGNLMNLWQTSDWLRYFIGLVWGVLLPYYFISGISELFLHHKLFSLKKEQQTK